MYILCITSFRPISNCSINYYSRLSRLRWEITCQLERWAALLSVEQPCWASEEWPTRANLQGLERKGQIQQLFHGYKRESLTGPHHGTSRNFPEPCGWQGLRAPARCQAWASEVGELGSGHWITRDLPDPRNINRWELSQRSPSQR